ncbi:MAG: accessory protein NosL [Leptospira sp.]|nr:accessory protein NosL [Leptospira sp.]
MHFRIRNFTIFAIVLSFLSGCGNSQPVHIEPGKVSCAHCSMSIVDMRFHTQTLTSKGRRYHFDSIECYYHFHEKIGGQSKKVWMSNFQNPNEYLDEDHAFIIKSNQIRSPMGEGYAAFKSKYDYDSIFQ